MYKIVKNYRDNSKLRHSFNELAKKTFGIDFEDWYQNGYWTDRYNPYSIVVEDKVVANVSVNWTPFLINGEVRQYIQLGTVMTAVEHRNKGYIRKLMEEVDKDYADVIDGMYLFANERVLDFYPKFGFHAIKEYEYIKSVAQSGKQLFKKVPMKNKEAWDDLEGKIRTCYAQSAVEMMDNSQLNMFYVSKFMQDNVYYSEEVDTYVIAEIEDEALNISMVISDKEQDLEAIAKGFGENIKQVVLGFTPKNTQGFEVREINQDDTVMFIKGGLQEIEEQKMMIPLLAHA